MACKISIITPSFNQAQFLEATIQSVLAQRAYVHEYLVVDGGSSDGSLEIIKKYSGELNWWVSEKDDGQSDAITKGFRRATGDVIAWINSDDVYLPGAIQRVQEAFDKKKDLQVATGFLVFIDANGRITNSYRMPAPTQLAYRFGPVLVSQPPTFFKRDLYNKVGGIDIALHCTMDRDLWTRFYRAKPVWETIPEYIAGFRKHSLAKGVSERWEKRYRAEEKKVQERYPDLANPIFNRLGLVFYRLQQVLSGRHVSSMVDSRRFRGKRIDEAFGLRRTPI